MSLLRIYTVVFLLAFGVFEVFAQDRTPQPTPSESEELVKSVQVFPNPAVEYVHIRVEQADVRNFTLSVHNIIGNEMPVETDVINEHELRLKVKDLATGYYLIGIKDEKLQLMRTLRILKR